MDRSTSLRKIIFVMPTIVVLKLNKNTLGNSLTLFSETARQTWESNSDFEFAVYLAFGVLVHFLCKWEATKSDPFVYHRVFDLVFIQRLIKT